MDLDNVDQILRLDESGLIEKIRNLHCQFREVSEILSQVDWDMSNYRDVKRIVFCGVGGSAIGGDFVRAHLGEELQVPFEVNRNYRIQSAIDLESLVILSSYSGNTEETLSCLDQALSKQCKILTLTSGGKLAVESSRLGIPIFRVPAGYPPRSTLGYSCGLTLEILSKLQVAPKQDLSGIADSLDAFSEQLVPGLPTDQNVAKQIAEKIQGHIAVFYGSAGHLGPVARRWCGQFAENGKQLSFFGELPEMNHNEIVGWKYPGNVLGNFYPVFFRDKSDNPRIQKRLQLTAKFLAVEAGGKEEIWVPGESWAERLWSFILLGDFVSVYAAVLNGQDPTPVEIIENFKNDLLGTGGDR